MVRGPLPHDHLPLVGGLVRLDIREPAWNALKRIRLLRCIVHNLDRWEYFGRVVVLCSTVYADGRIELHHLAATHRQHDHHTGGA